MLVEQCGRMAWAPADSQVLNPSKCIPLDGTTIRIDLSLTVDQETTSWIPTLCDFLSARYPIISRTFAR